MGKIFWGKNVERHALVAGTILGGLGDEMGE